MVALGEGLAAGPRRSRDELVVQSDLTSEVAAQLAPEIRRLEMLVRSLVPQNYPTPQVTVQAHVDAPVTVQAEAPESPEISLSMPGMGDLCGEVTALRNDVQSLTAALMTPVKRTVTRDAQGLILTITETR